MSYYQSDVKRAIRANETRRKGAEAELSKLGLEDLFETGQLTAALYKAAKWAEKHSSTYREIVVAIMEALGRMEGEGGGYPRGRASLCQARR